MGTEKEYRCYIIYTKNLTLYKLYNIIMIESVERSLLPMKGKELIKLLEKAGWKLDRIQGSHHIMIKGDKTEVVPCHNKDIPIGLLNAIKKRTGLK